MYRPHTLYSDLGDVEIIQHDGLLHLFHLVIPNRDVIAHAVSEDGLQWRELPPAITTSAPGAPDDDMIRTVSVTPHDGRFYMMYSGCSRKDGGTIERVCIAVSDDLYNWEKIPNASGIEAYPAIYEGEDLSNNGVNWRDPKPFYEDGVYYCVICARRKEGPLLRKGCVALMVSRDMIHWDYEEPIFLPGAYYTVECPQLYRIGKLYYLIGSIMEDSSQRYWVADNIKGPYRVASGENLLFPPKSHYAGRLCRFQGKDVFLCWTFATEDGPSPFGLRVNKNAPIRYIPALLEVMADDEGRLSLKSCQSWGNYEDQKYAISIESLHKTACDNPYAVSEDQSFISESGMEMWLSEDQYSCFKLDMNMTVGGYCGGIVFHVNDDTAAYQIEFYPHQQLARLVIHNKKIRSDNVEWFDYRVLQTTHCVSENQQIRVGLLAVGGEIEVSLNGCVKFSTVSTSLQKGHIGVFSNCGSVIVSRLSLTGMRMPNH